MSITKYAITCATAISLLTSCESRAGTGALVGGGLGVGAGALIGGGQGALIGGAIGAIGGGLIGAILDSEDQQRLHNESRRTYDKVDRGERLSVRDIISLHRAGIRDSKIIELIDKTGSTYRLTTFQIDKLRKAGVSETVINYMLNT